MYLPQLKEEVGILAKNPKVRIAVAVILICLVFAGGWLLCQHYGNLERGDRDNVSTTIRNAQTRLTQQNESLATLSEKINKEAHKTATVKRQRDTWAVVAGALAVSCLIK